MPLSEEVFEAIKPIYELSLDELRSSCLEDFSLKIASESFNASVKPMLSPKMYSSGKKILDIAVSNATCNFKDDITSI